MDQVFFGTMVISQLSQMNLKGGALGKVFGTLSKVIKGGGAATKTFATSMGAGADATSWNDRSYRKTKIRTFSNGRSTRVATASIGGIGTAVSCCSCSISNILGRI